MRNTHLLRQVNKVKEYFEYTIDALLSEIEELEDDNSRLQDELDSLKERILDLEQDIRSPQ